MDSFTIAGIVFACTFGGALLGMLLRRVLPEAHLSSDAKDVVKLCTGLVATLSALVLGLLVASAKSSFDLQRTGFQQLSMNLIILDHDLKRYGPETREIRERLRETVKLFLDHRWPADGSQQVSLDSPEIAQSAGLWYLAMNDLKPQTEAQKLIQSQALQVSAELARTRWLLNQATESSIPTPFSFVLIFWLTVLFITFGLFSPRNTTVTVIILICSLSLAAALFLIFELDQPYDGLIQISSKPMRIALGQIGQ